MSQYDYALLLSDLTTGSVKGCSVQGVALALYNVNGDVYATQDECSHGKTSLSDGELDGYEIECPMHRGTFDVRSGRPGALPCITPIKTFPIKVEDGKVFVCLE